MSAPNYAALVPTVTNATCSTTPCAKGSTCSSNSDCTTGHHVVRLRTPIGLFFQTFGKQYIQTMVIL